MLTAITRQISSSMTRCELTHLDRTPIDLDLARAQHRQYVQALSALGLRVQTLPEQPDLPDSVFVEDVAVVVDEIAVLTNPGAESRRPEVETVAEALRPFRKLSAIQPPAMVDGGDVLRLGKRLLVGLSTRSTPAAVDQMQAILAPYGYSVEGVTVTGCLHLKSAVTQVAEHILLVNPAWVDTALFPGWEIIPIDPSEAYAANALWVGSGIIYPTSFPRTLARLRERGLHIETVDATEVQKAEGAVTCCSLVFTTA